MWAIIGPFIAKYWAKILAMAALVGGGLYAGLKIMGALDKGKIERAEHNAAQATATAKIADQAVKVEKAKTEQVKAETSIKEQGRQDEQVVQDSAGDDLLDIANSMFNDSKTD